MALKKKLTKAEFEKLKDEFKAEYIADGDGYKLDLEGDDDIGPLRRALERERASSTTNKQRVEELEAEIEKLQGDDARKRGDIQTLEKSWQSKLDKKEQEYSEKLSKREGFIKSQLVDAKASEIAHKISKAPALLLPHIKARLVADLDGDSPVTRVLDKDGKVSAMTLEELQAEFVANKDFSAIITASKASGGAGPSNNGGGAPNNAGNNSGQQPADLSKMNPRQLADALKEKKAQQQDA